MTRPLLSCLLALLLWTTAPTAGAQTAAEPFVEVDMPETEVIPGQPLVLRMTVLVPTWLPKPVAFPNLEAPDLMVKLLERSTSPTSRTIDGETWSGVTRAYRLSPMVPGTIAIPSQELVISWAEPGKTDPLVTTIAIDPFTITGIVPEGASDLDPFIAANALTLTQDLSTDARTLEPGDSLTRTLTVDVSGTSPLFVPTLLPPHQIEGVASYPVEPTVTETADRNWLSGTRVESTTLVAESGGAGTVPPVEIAWYNLESGKVETARVDGFDLTVDGPVARAQSDFDLRRAMLRAILALVALFLAYRVARVLRPRLAAWQTARQSAHEASEAWAYDQAQKTIRRRDYAAFSIACETWLARTTLSASQISNLMTEVTALGACLFGTAPSDADLAWTRLSRALSDTRATTLRQARNERQRQPLAPLNPR